MHCFLTVLALILLYGGHSMAAIKGHAQVSCIISGFPHHLIMRPNR